MDTNKKKINSNKYLEDELNKNTNTTNNNNLVRSSLINYFKDRECIFMVIPMYEEN